MNLRKPIIAAIVAALLLGAFLADRNRTRTENLQQAQAMRIMEFDFMDATMVLLENESGTYRLEKRDGDEWWVTTPVEMRADVGQVKALVDNIRGAKKSLPFRPDDLETYGLDDPMPIVTVQASVAGKDEKVRLLFGREASQLGRVYAMVDGTDDVFTVGDWVRNQAQKDLQLLRDKMLLRFDPVDVQTIAIGGQRQQFELKRDTKGEFPWLLDDDRTPADGEMVDRMLASLSQARAVAMMDDPATSTAALGFTSPTLTVEIALADGKKQRLEVGNKLAGEGDFFARSNLNDTIGVLRSTTFSDFLRPRMEWSTKRFLWLTPEQIQRLETRSGRAEMAMARNEEGNWEFEEFPDLEMNPEKLSSFLQAATSFAADRPIGGAALRRYGLDSPSLELIAWGADGKAQGLRVGTVDTAEGIAYAERLQDHTIWGIDFQRVNELYKFRRDLEERRIQTGFGDRTEHVRLLTGQNTVEITKQSGVWKLSFPGQATRVVSDDKVDTFIARAEALEWNSELVSGDAGASNLKLEFLDADDEVIYQFELLADANGDPLVRTGGRTYYVEPKQLSLLDQSMVDLLRRDNE
ncbi:DUF4340 domain-containing protein [bacterium]|nr:DUF4340 domain-containing protein [bacterium]